MLAEDLWRLFDIIGTLAFAVSGTLVGISRRMDIFGISVLALATAVGGGMVRDMLVGIMPPMALRNTTNFLLSVGVALLTSLLYQWTALHHMRRRRLLTMFNVSDTIGLAAFTITGALTGVRFGGDDSYVLPVLLAATTAVGGGMIRDVLAQRMPVVLYAEVYAAASLAGAFVFCMLR
ncbi:trimeric intracellular cation channel family protein, partial [Selenomonas noxia]|uniref:trimeric intracellular cation channel family protein n=1 Tax=Selenomonas noxia TaxID=135083 RepID=UPI0028ED243E